MGDNLEMFPLSGVIKRAAKHAVVWSLLAGILGVAIFVTSGIVVVDKGSAAVMIRKTGEPLPSGEIIALTSDQMGIQLDPLSEGWHWRNPYTWDWIYIEQVMIPEGRLGLQIRNFGKPLKPGQVIADDGEKGVLKEILRPGRYMINTLAYSITLYNAVNVEPGHMGVVTNVSGTEPEDPNQFLMQLGERGVQKATKPPGTYYPHPFMEKIVPVDSRSHRFDMTGEKIIKFPSLDGFDITMEGTIEWYINPDRVAEVYVKYVDERDVITCIVAEIILPNARAFSRIEGSKHLAREFIGGLTREKFQSEFLRGVKTSCAAQGIEIQSALVRQITPPPAISSPIKNREIAIRKKEMYGQQMEREKQEKLLAMETKIKERKTLITQATADVSVAVTMATQEKEVAIIDATRELEVAKLQMTAAANQAAAKLAKGQAEADVIVFKNAAEASGLKESAEAFESGHTFVRYLMNQKLAPSIGYVLSNTDGPFAEILKRAMTGNASGVGALNPGPKPTVVEKKEGSE